MDFITIDFETANASRNSPCELGLTFVEAGKIVDTKSWLIKPQGNQFDDFNISIHGITPADVAGEPEFHELWPEVCRYIEGRFLIAHNASFDFSVLRKTLDLYNIPYPELKYSCSYILAKKTWVGLPAYDLKTLCNYKNINFIHHRAASDSLATAKLATKLFEEKAILEIDDIQNKLNTYIGKLHLGGYSPSETIHVKKPIQPITGIGEHNPESVFYGKSVVFTGAMSSMTRREAAQVLTNIGGVYSDSLTKSTDFLIVGNQDYRVVGEDGMSSKQEKAIKMKAANDPIEIMSESDFLKNI